MELTFLGRGAGFNPVEGSNSAYFIDSNELFLIDAGESVFRTILEKKLLDSISKINILITHTHSDHVGSLGSLILYAFAVKKLDICVVTGENMDYLPSVKSLLVIYGLTANMYRFVDISVFDGKYSLFSKVRYFKTKHCDELETCGVLFETDAGLVVYTSDLCEIEPLADIVNSGRPIDKFYVDTNNDRHPNPHHISIYQFNEIVTPELRPKVYCMHIKNVQCIEAANALNFKIVTTS